MKLDKLQRHTAYIILLAELEEATWGLWLCELFEVATGLRPTKEMLPELFKFKPKESHYSGGWWDGYDYKARASALKQCIEETY